jgi:hypothetical protein
MKTGARVLWRWCALSATILAVAVAAYLLWRTQLASRPVNVAADILQFGIGFSALAIALAAPMLATLARWSAVRYLVFSVVALCVVFFLYLNQLACSMKKTGVCEPIF